jgi:nucleolin
LKKPAAKAGKAAAKKKDSDSDDSDEESEDEAPKRKQSNVSQSKKAPAKKAKENDEDEDDNAGADGPRELFVGNLAFTTDENTINELFSQYGTVTNVKVPQQMGKPKGFAFVEFATHKEAKAAVDNLNG